MGRRAASRFEVGTPPYNDSLVSGRRRPCDGLGSSKRRVAVMRRDTLVASLLPDHLTSTPHDVASSLDTSYLKRPTMLTGTHT
ncbi:hypothetical protein EVG20_g10423 [Dentipellis fragilis]|uniref:Uncharacterized protein n=1 Tax=Dentipellis fragilis TaxID=205917 RepID=A0A4Y9XUC6_9AGAM|nr:hypothetical protein EVG20_g10423 [Dentipellis fragilis]